VKNVYFDFYTVPGIKLPTYTRIPAKQLHFLLLVESYNLISCKFSCQVILNYFEYFTVSIVKMGVDETEGKYSWYMMCPSESAG